MRCMFPEIWSGTDRVYLFSTSFCRFTLIATQKIKILKKFKKHLEISSFYTKFPKNDDHMLYCSWDMARDGCNFYFSFWAIFCLLPPPPSHPPHPPHPPSPNSLKNQNLKKWKKHLEISPIYTCVPKIMIRWCTVSWDMMHDGWTDRQMGGQKKWHMEVGAPPKNMPNNTNSSNLCFKLPQSNGLQWKTHHCTMQFMC